jgi:flavodoxin
MNTKIIYFSKTGHSKKIAQRIAEDLKIDVLNAKDQPKLQDVDLLFMVGGIYGGKSDPKFLEYIDQIDEGAVKKAILMTSCTSSKSTQDQVRQKLEAKGITVFKDEFLCRGNFLIFGWGHPNKEDIQNAVDFAKEHYNSEAE